MKWSPFRPCFYFPSILLGAIFILFSDDILAKTPLPMPPQDQSQAALGESFSGLTDNIPQLLLSTVNDKIAGKIIAKNFDYEAPSTVTLYGVQIRAPDGTSVVDVRKLKITLSVTALFSGELLFEEIVLQDPTVQLKSRKGRLNIERAFDTKRTSSSSNSDDSNLEIYIEKLLIKKGSFSFANEQGMKIKFSSLATSGKMEFSGGNLITRFDNFVFKSGRFENPDLAIQLGKTKIRKAELLGKLIRFSDLKCATLGGSLKLNGQVNTKGKGRLKLSGSFWLPKNAWPEKIERLAFDTPSIQGSMKLTGSFKSPLIFLNTSFESFEAYDYALSSGKASINITPKDVHITSLNTQLKAGGEISGEVYYNFNTKVAQLENTLSNVPAKALVPKTKLARQLKGVLNGSLNTKIQVADKMEIDATYNLKTRNFSLTSVYLPYYSRLKGSVNFKNRRIRLRNNRITSKDFSLTYDGQVSLKHKTLNLDTRIETNRIKDIVKTIPENLTLGTTLAEGTVTGSFDNYLYEGDLKIDNVTYDSFVLNDLSTPVVVTPEQVFISQLEAETAGGLCNLELTLDLSQEEVIGLAGSGQLHEIQLASVDLVQPESHPLTGDLSADFQLSGNTEAPKIEFSVRGQSIAYSDIQEGEIQLSGALFYPRLLIQRLQIQAPGIHLSSEKIEADMESEELAGLIHINTVDLNPFAAAEDIPAQGQMAGWLKLSGALKRPDAEAGLLFSSLNYDDRALGDGKFRVHATSLNEAETDYEISVSGLITSSNGTFSIQNYFRTTTETLLAKIKLMDVDLQHYGSGWSESIPPMDGVLMGQIHITGKLDSPHLETVLSIPQLGLLLIEEQQDSERETEDKEENHSLTPFKYLGPVQVRGSYESGLVDARVCAFPNFTENARTRSTICTKNERLQTQIQGHYKTETESLLRVKMELDFDQLADYLPSLAQAQINTGIHLTSSFNVQRQDNEAPWNIEGSGRVLDVGFQSPESPRFTLKQPFALQFTKQSVRLNTPIELETESGQLTVSGFYAPEELELNAQGQVALAFVSLFTDSITQSEGLLDLKVQAKGTAEKPFIEGMIKPKPGAFLHIASIDQDLIFESGALAFAQETLRLEEEEEETIRISFVELKMKTDTGDLSIDGDAILNPPGNPIFDETPVHFWDLQVHGTGLAYEATQTQVECSTHLIMKGEGTGPKLEGQIEITEGQLQKEFKLNNFVMTAADETPSTPLYKTLYFLEDLQFDVAIAIQSFEVHTIMNSFSLETDVQGRLQLQQNLREPLLTGSVELSEGQVAFPYADFELASASVDFKQTPGRFIDPNFRLEAWSEITQRDVPQLQQDTLPLVLILDGDLDQMQLDLRAEDGSEYSRTDLLALVLLGYLPSLSGDTTGSGPSADNALRAVSRELTSSTRQQVEDVLRQKLGANVQVDLYADSSGVKTGVRWHLGKRLELEGAGGIQFGGDSSAQNNDLRLRFLIFDHLPLGKELFLEGGLASPPSTDQNASPRGDIRLTYRILEQ